MGSSTGKYEKGVNESKLCKYQLEAAFFPGSFRRNKKVRPPELRNAISWPHSWAGAT